jgi:hypothetical protein
LKVSKRRKRKKQRKRLPDDHVDALLIYVSQLIIAMGLPSYRVLIMEEPADDDAIAEIKHIDGRYVAEVYLGKDWLERSDDEQRDTITHEVLHLWHRRLTDWLNAELRDLMHDHEFERIERQFHSEAELMVDNIAMIMSDTFRLKEAWREAHDGSSPSRVLKAPSIAH